MLSGSTVCLLCLLNLAQCAEDLDARISAEILVDLRPFAVLRDIRLTIRVVDIHQLVAATRWCLASFDCRFLKRHRPCWGLRDSSNRLFRALLFQPHYSE